VARKNIEAQNQSSNASSLLELTPQDLKEHFDTFFSKQISLNGKQFSEWLRTWERERQRAYAFGRFIELIRFISRILGIIVLTVLSVYLCNKNPELLKELAKSVGPYLGLGVGIGGGVTMVVMKYQAGKSIHREADLSELRKL
jgi:hypothetical protein